MGGRTDERVNQRRGPSSSSLRDGVGGGLGGGGVAMAGLPRLLSSASRALEASS